MHLTHSYVSKTMPPRVSATRVSAPRVSAGGEGLRVDLDESPQGGPAPGQFHPASPTARDFDTGGGAFRNWRGSGSSKTEQRNKRQGSELLDIKLMPREKEAQGLEEAQGLDDEEQEIKLGLLPLLPPHPAMFTPMSKSGSRVGTFPGALTSPPPRRLASLKGLHKGAGCNTTPNHLHAHTHTHAHLAPSPPHTQQQRAIKGTTPRAFQRALI